MRECILTSRDQGWYQWAQQFAGSRRDRSMVAFPSVRGGRALTRAQILAAYRQAARRARDGMLIVSAGHGGTAGLSNGMVDLAPDGALRLTGAHLSLYAAGRLQRRDLPVVQTVIAIGGILRQNTVRKVLFISCNVGRSLEFLGAIAGHWGGCTVGGYRPLVNIAWIELQRGRRTYYVYLGDDRPRSDDAIRARSTNYPPLLPPAYASASRPVRALRTRRAGVPPPMVTH